jgi:hypothetical protein
MVNSYRWPRKMSRLLASVIAGTSEAGKSYWMAFSNSGRLLKRGDRVDIVIGNFHAEGLMIE